MLEEAYRCVSTRCQVLTGARQVGLPKIRTTGVKDAKWCHASGLTVGSHLKKMNEPGKQPTRGGGQNLEGERKSSKVGRIAGGSASRITTREKGSVVQDGGDMRVQHTSWQTWIFLIMDEVLSLATTRDSLYKWHRTIGDVAD